MRIPITALVLFLSLPASGATADGFITPSVRAALERLMQQAPQWTQVHMRVWAHTGTFFEIQEHGLAIAFNGHRNSLNHFQFSGRADGKFMSFTADPRSSDPDRNEGFDFWGGGVDLRLLPSGSGYRVWGEVEQKRLDLFIDRFGRTDLRIMGQGGLNLSAQSMGQDAIVGGSVDLAQIDKARVAVIGAIVAVIRATEPPARDSARKP